MLRANDFMGEKTTGSSAMRSLRISVRTAPPTLLPIPHRKMPSLDCRSRSLRAKIWATGSPASIPYFVQTNAFGIKAVTIRLALSQLLSHNHDMRKQKTPQSLAAELCRYLKEQRVHPDEVAERAGVHRATVYRILQSQSRKTVGSGLRRLCKVAEIDIYEGVDNDSGRTRQEAFMDPLCAILAKWWDGSEEHAERLRRVLPLICQVTTVRTEDLQQ